MVGLATCSGASGGEASGGSSWCLERRGEKGREKTAETGERDWFLADFGSDFLLPQAMKSTSIYRRWKRTIFSILEKLFSP